jgi:hypothetical protein
MLTISLPPRGTACSISAGEQLWPVGRGALTFDVKLGVDDVAHDGGKVEVFDCFLGTPSAGEEHTGQAQVFTSTRVKKDLHFFHLTILSAHILQEGFPHIVIQSCESHFLQWDLSNIELIQLWRGQELVWGLYTDHHSFALWETLAISLRPRESSQRLQTKR